MANRHRRGRHLLASVESEARNQMSVPSASKSPHSSDGCQQQRERYYGCEEGVHTCEWSIRRMLHSRGCRCDGGHVCVLDDSVSIQNVSVHGD